VEVLDFDVFEGLHGSKGLWVSNRLWKVLEVFVALSYIVYASALQRFA